MANSDKDIRVVPNRNKSGLPNIAFTGYNNDPIVLNVLDDNTISFEGSSGQLFSVSNAVTTGTIFSVNDISGIPSFRVDADGTVGIAEFSGNVGIGLQSPQSKLSVGGDINVGAGYTFRVAGAKVLDSSSLGTGVTGSSLTSVGTISSGAWQGTAIGVNYGGTGATNASDARSFIGAATAGTNSDLTRLLGVQQLFVTIPTAAAIGITVKAATSQSASMMEFVNSSNSLLAWITKDGTFAHGAYFTHNDGRVPGISVQRANAAGIVARGFNSDAFPAIEVQNNGGGLGVGLYPGGLVYGGVLQAWASTASTNTTTGALIVAGGAAIAGTTNFGRDVRIFSSLASSSPFTGSLVVSGGVGISNNLFVGGGVAFTSSIASTSTATGTLVVTGGVGIGGSVFTSTSNASSISGVVLSNGSVTLTGTYTQSNSSTTAFQVRDGSNNPAFVIDTIGDVISLPVAVASTSTGTGSLVVAGGVGIGGSLYTGSINVSNDLTHLPYSTTIGGASGWSYTNIPVAFTFLNNKYVGTAGTYVYYSDDLVNWSSVMVPQLDPTRNISNIAYGDGKYVFVQYYTSNAGYSTNLVNWTKTSMTYNTWLRVVYGNGRFVADSGGTNYAYSLDGVTWTTVTDSKLGYGQTLQFINGYFYSCNSNTIARSVDGINWQACNTTAIPYGLAYGNGLYVGGVYNSGTIVYSYDGLNFSTYSGTSYVHNNSWFYNGIYYLTTNNDNAIRYSTDGFNWSIIGGFPAAVNNLYYHKGRLYASSGSSVWMTNATPGRFEINPYRTGNLDNVEIGRISPNNANFIDVSVNNNLNVSSLYNSTLPQNGALTVAGGVGIGQSVNIGGKLDVSNTINYTATNSGIANTWTRIAIPSPVSISGLTYGNGLYVGVGYSAATSTDGITWTARSLPHNLTGVGYGNGLYVGVLGASSLGATSTDGITWRSMTLPSSVNWNKVAYGNGIYVASSDSTTVAYSYNGFQWTSTGLFWPGGFLQLAPVEFGGGYFIIKSNGSSSYWISVDGINWTRRTNFTTGNVAANSVAYGDGAWVLAGSSASLAYTKDLLTFTYSSHYGWSGSVNNIAYTNGTFAIVDANSLQCTLIYKNLTSINASYLPGPIAATTIAAGEGKFVAGAGSTVYVTDIASHTFNIFPHNSGEINNVRIGAKYPSSAQFSHLNANNLVSFGSSSPSTSTTTGALVITGGVGIGGSLFVGNTLSVASSTASTSSLSGALIVSGGVGIGGSINSTGLFNFGTLQAPTMSSISGFGTGGLSPSTTYYYKLSAIDYNNNESLPSPEYSVTTSASQYGTRFYISTSPGASGYKLYRTTTSGNYTDSYVQTYRTYQQFNSVFRYDVGKATSAGSPVSRATGNTVTLGSSSSVPFNVLPSLTIPSGSLQVKSPNVSSFANPSGIQAAIETGTLDYLAIRDAFGFNGLSASTGGTLTPGQTYYYVATIVDHYGNESLPTEELAITADAGGAVIISFNVTSVQVPAIRVYRTTTPGNYTNSYLGELPGNKDIGYPTMSGSPPTTTSFAGIRLNPRADFDVMSYIPNIDLAPSHRNGILRKLDVPYTGAIAVTTSGIAGSLLPNTTYYYKCSAFDIFGGSAYPTAEVSVSTGTSTAVTISGGSGLIYAKVYRSTVKNSYSNVPTYYVSSFPFTDRGDTTFTDTPSNVSNYIQSQLFRNGNNQVPQNYLRDLSIGPILNNFPFSILAPVTGLNSVTASTGGTLVEGQVYHYVMEAVDVYNYGSSSGQPIRFVATAGGAANVSQSVVGGYGYVAWNLYRTSNLASWTNSLIAAGIKGNNFIDIGYPGRSGSPNFGYHRARNVVYDNRGVFHIPTIANQFYGQNLTATSTPYRTGGNSAGSLTTNTTYYYRVIPYGGANQSYGYASDEFQYTTGANEKNISMSIGGHKIGAMYYRVYRSTTFNNFTNAYYFETPHINFIDYGHTALQATADVFINSVPYANTVNLLNQGSGNYLAYTTITGQSGGLKIHLKSPVISSISSGTGGTLSTNTDYWYKVDAIDAHGVRTFVSDEAYVNTGSNNSVTLTWDDVPGAYYYRVFRATASQTFANKLIASYVNARTFTDLNFPTTTGTPVTIFENGQQGATAALFQMDNSKVFGVMPRTVISNIDSTQSTWYTDFSLRITSPPVGSASGALLQVGAGFTNFSSAGFNGTTYGTQIAIGAAIGFTGSLLDAQTAGVSRFRINFDGSSNIGSTTGSGSTSTGALIVSGGVGIGQSLFTSPSYSSSISGAIFSNGSATLSGTFTQNNSSTTAFQVRDGSNNPAFVIDTIGDIISLPVAVASTSTGTGSLVVAGGVGIGQSINIGGRVGIGTNLLDATLNIRTSTAATPGIVIQGSTSQSASLFSVNSSVGGSFFEITNSGIVNIKTSTAGDFNSVPLQRWYGDNNSIVGVFQKGGFLYTGYGLGYVDGAGSQTLVHQWVPNGSYYITNWSKRMANGTQIMFASSAGGDVRIYGDTNGSLTFQSYGTYTNNTMVKLMDPSPGTNQALLGIVTPGGGNTRSQLFSYGNLALNMTVAGQAGTDWDATNLFRANVNTKTKYLGNLAVLAVDDTNRFTVGPYGNTTVALGGTTASTGFIIKAASSQTGNLFEAQSSTGATLTFIDASGNASVGGTLNISGNASIGGTLNVSGSNSYFQNNLYVGNNTQGRLYFSQATLGSAGTTVIPTMAFIGATNSPITLSVLPDNSLSFDGSSGQLFSINNNLSTGWIFSINDISGLPIFRTNADLTVAMGEYGGNVGIGLSNPTFKLQVSGNAGISGTTLISNTTTSTNTTSGALVVSGGVGIGGSLNVTSASTISGVTINSGVITGSLTGTATTATYANQSGYAITSGSSNTSGYADQSGYGLTSGLATTATYALQSGYAITSGSSNTSGYATTSGLATTANYAHQSGYAITSGSANTALYSDQSGYGLTSGLATTATYANQSGYAITSGSSNTSGYATTAGLATTAANINTVSSTSSDGNYIVFSPVDGGSGVALSTTSSIYVIPDIGYLTAPILDTQSITSTDGNITNFTGTAVTATNFYGPLAGNVTGTATTSRNVNIVSASTNASHPVLFTPATGTASGAALSTESTFVYNPSTDILSVSGLAITSTTASTSTSTGALTVSGGVGIGQTLFTSSSYASSISGVVLSNGAITNTGTITSTGVMSLSNSSTTALSIKDGSNSTKFNVNTIGGVVSVSSSTASTNTLTGALVVGGGLGVSGDLFVCSIPNSRLSVMHSSGDEGGEIFLNKPVTNTTINTGLTIDIYQNRLRFFEAGGSNRGFYLDIPSGGNSVGTNLLGGGSGTVSTLTAGTGISFSTGATITTTGTIRARRPLVASFCAGYTPAASGADSVVIRLPDSPSDGTTAITYEPQEFHIRVETASATTTTIQLEKYTGTGAFSGTAITSVSISGGSTYEAQTSVFAGAGIFLTSGDKLRINFTALSASHANFSVYLELEEV